MRDVSRRAEERDAGRSDDHPNPHLRPPDSTRVDDRTIGQKTAHDGGHWGFRDSLRAVRSPLTAGRARRVDCIAMNSPVARPRHPVAVITGAGRGIGRAIAEALAPEHRLVLVGRKRSPLDALANALEAGGVGIEVITCDLADPVQTGSLAAALTSRPEPVQVLVNNAGIAPSAPLAKTSDEDWQRVLSINLTAPFVLCRALAPGMAQAGWGRIVNIASTSALKGYKFTGAYSASKGGVLALTRAIAAEFVDKGITVNAICPGFTDTDIVADAVRNIAEKTGRSAQQARESLERFSPMKRLVSPVEVASWVAHLVGDAGASITGQSLCIDGGETTL